MVRANAAKTAKIRWQGPLFESLARSAGFARTYSLFMRLPC